MRATQRPAGLSECQLTMREPSIRMLQTTYLGAGGPGLVLWPLAVGMSPVQKGRRRGGGATVTDPHKKTLCLPRLPRSGLAADGCAARARVSCLRLMSQGQPDHVSLF